METQMVGNTWKYIKDNSFTELDDQSVALTGTQRIQHLLCTSLPYQGNLNITTVIV